MFRKGDVILEVNGVVIDSVDTLNDAINKSDGFWQFAINRSGRVIRMQLAAEHARRADGQSLPGGRA